MQQNLMPGSVGLANIQQQIDDLGLEHDAAIQRRAVVRSQHRADLQRAYDDEQKRFLEEAPIRQNTWAQRGIGLAAKHHRRSGPADSRPAVTANSNTPIVTVLDPAKASTEPTSPNRHRILMLTGLWDLSGSSLVAGCLEMSMLGGLLDRLGVNLPVLAEAAVLATDFGPIGRGELTLLSGRAGLEEISKGFMPL